VLASVKGCWCGLQVNLHQCCQLGGFPAQLGWFLRSVAGFFLLLRVAVFWPGFIKMLAVFWASFSKDFSVKEYSFYQFC